MSLIVAINPGFGSSIGVFKDGVPVFCVEEERFNRVKNWLGFPIKAFGYIFEQGIANIDDVDYFVLTNEAEIPTKSREGFYGYYDEYYAAAEKLAVAPSEIKKYRLKQKVWSSPMYKMVKGGGNAAPSSDGPNAYEKTLLGLGVPQEKIRKENHHLCHAAAAYYGLATDPEKEYLVFSLDGGGDGLTAAIYKGEKGQLERVYSSTEYSIGNMYSATTYHLGFTPHEHEYKLMGLAPYVKDKYADRCLPFFRKFLELKNNDTEFHNPESLNHAIYFAHLISGLRRERFDNVAASLQLFCEEIVTRWVKGNVAKYGITDILCSGGVFMNVKMNMLFTQMPELTSVNVQPSCGDETNIFGAAYLTQAAKFEPKIDLMPTFCVGTSAEVGLEAVLQQYSDKVNAVKASDVNKEIARLLSENKIVARCTGPMEFGARSLGNRSIMANPSEMKNIAKINQAIKNRDFWMPFAPAIREDDLEEYVVVPDALKPHLSPYMMFAFDTVREKVDDITCGVHQADFTARVETIGKDRYPDFHEIITAFKSLTGIGCVLNTSFNLHGFPIVENAEQAVDVLLQSKLDVLAIGDYLITRK
jgi:carbamoyltransferase